MNQATITTITTAFFTLLAVIVPIMINRKSNSVKTMAEANATNAGGEKTASELYRDYALQVKKDKEEVQSQLTDLQKQFKELSSKFDIITQEKTVLADAAAAKDAIIKSQGEEIKKLKETVESFERIVTELRDEVERYKMQASPEHLAEVAHKAIDVAKEELINHQ